MLTKLKQNIASICMYQFTSTKLSSQQKGGSKLCLQRRHLEYSCMFYRPIAVKQRVLLFSPPQTKEQDKSIPYGYKVFCYLLEAVCKSPVLITQETRKYQLVRDTASCFDDGSLYTPRSGTNHRNGQVVINTKYAGKVNNRWLSDKLQQESSKLQSVS